MKDYCSQNHGDCRTCSLSSYNQDCMGLPIVDQDADEELLDQLHTLRAERMAEEFRRRQD